MIQPLRRGKKTWLLYWLELDEPVTTSQGYQLPTILILGDAAGVPLCPPEIDQELRQDTAEQLVQTAVEKHGTPERLLIGESPEWEAEAWQDFAKEFNFEIRFRKLEAHDTQHLKKFADTLSQTQSEKHPSSRQNSKEIVESLFKNYQRLHSLRRRRTWLKTILKIDPDQAAAWVELGDILLADGRWDAADDAFMKATQTPQIVALKHKKKFSRPVWEDPDINLMLRSCFGSAMCMWHQGKYATAAKFFLDVRNLNPSDHQGARFYIPLLYLLDDSLEQAIAAFEDYEKNYPDDFPEPAFRFARALTEHLQGRENEAKQLYQTSILKNIYIAPLLLDEKLPDTNIWHPTERAEPDYAEEFIDSYSVLWDREAASLRLLREAWIECEPIVQRLIIHRKLIHSFQDQRYDPNYKSTWRKLLETDDVISSWRPLI